jgi:hypothetical protein
MARVMHAAGHACACCLPRRCLWRRTTACHAILGGAAVLDMGPAIPTWQLSRALHLFLLRLSEWRSKKGLIRWNSFIWSLFLIFFRFLGYFCVICRRLCSAFFPGGWNVCTVDVHTGRGYARVTGSRRIARTCAWGYMDAVLPRRDPTKKGSY